MSIGAGSRIGSYEVIAAIGAGGMGEVYRARDTRLNRDVALKILPDAFASDPERLARFEREAQVLASLNHPHIAAIHGIEESDGVRALVLEFVDGETLADRIARGPIPIDETLAIARQIAEALEAAHEQGIIHRDLKPANIKLRNDGTIKVLDFGLAKLAQPAGPAAGNSTTASLSPTITSPALMTGVGTLLGTAAYMSPEQAKGREADRRSDIWAFGCVLYEMLTATRAFKGDDVSDTLASVLARAPDFAALPPRVNPRLRGLLSRCLERDPARRWQAIGDVRFEVDEILTAPHAGMSVSPPATASRWRYLAGYGVPALIIGAILGVASVRLAAPRASQPIIRTTIHAEGDYRLGPDRVIAITPDGMRVVYVGNNGTRLFVRPLDSLQITAIASGRDFRAPFVSPDGAWVGVFDGQQLVRVPISGGPPIPIVEAIDGSTPRGASWGTDGEIVFATSNTATGLQRVSAAGGPVTVVTRPDRAHAEGDHEWPHVLAGGAILYTTRSQDDTDEGNIAVLDPATMRQQILVRGGSYARYLATGHLVYAASGTLRALPFDVQRLEVRGAPVTVLSSVAVSNLRYASFAVAANGTLVYVDAPPDTSGLGPRTLAWIDRNGKEQDIPVPPRVYQNPRISPDGTSIAVATLSQRGTPLATGGGDIFIWDIRHSFLRRLTMNASRDDFPVWTPDSRSIVYASAEAGGNINLWRVLADGSRPAERLLTSTNLQIPSSITPDGGTVIYHEVVPETSADVFRVAFRDPRMPEPLVRTKSVDRQAVVSPNGRWLAYESGGTGAPFEVFVRPFAGGTQPQWQVSTAGGSRPVWGNNELFYVAPDNSLMHVSVAAGAMTWNGGNPIKLIDRLPAVPDGADFTRTYDVSPDGQRFVVVKGLTELSLANGSSVVVVQRWDQEVAARVAAK